MGRRAFVDRPSVSSDRRRLGPRSPAKRPHGRWWLAVAIAVSVAANMLARYLDLAATAGPIVSAWPPLALFGTHRLLHRR